MTDDLSLSCQEFSIFCDLVTSFHTTLDMDEMLQTMFEQLTSIIAIEGISIALHDPAHKQFYFIRTVEGRPTKSLHFPDTRGIAGWVMTNMEPVLINDVTQDERYHGWLDPIQDFITASMICVPLRSRKGFLGVLYALNKIGGAFTAKDQKIIETISGTIAVSLENALLYGELKDHLVTLEREKQFLLSQVQAETGFNAIIGSSKPMQRMFGLLEKVIDTTTTVLIQGETGTGKELIARVIHYNGPLKDKAFVAENCAALSDSLLESELFGHTKGSFTGAVANKKGLFEIADGGTIFLDEIGEMSPVMQVKLLRVLQEGKVRPVGSSNTVTIDVRVIAATNRNLKDEMAAGKFREDLYYRINVFQVTPPPLRERKEDILSLANHFMAKFARKQNREIPILSPRALDILTSFDWPGNVRELENEMERAVTIAAGDTTITPEFLSDKLRDAQIGELVAESEQPVTIKEAVQLLEQRMIRTCMKTCGGNRSKAAVRLGLSRQGLHNKLISYGIETDT
jgi:Nif-specific regulatory protein